MHVGFNVVVHAFVNPCRDVVSRVVLFPFAVGVTYVMFYMLFYAVVDGIESDAGLRFLFVAMLVPRSLMRSSRPACTE